MQSGDAKAHAATGSVYATGRVIAIATVRPDPGPGGSVESATVHVPGGKDVTGRRNDPAP
jgi:hypothetical protein